jgi:hypothetical protein
MTHEPICASCPGKVWKGAERHECFLVKGGIQVSGYCRLTFPTASLVHEYCFNLSKLPQKHHSIQALEHKTDVFLESFTNCHPGLMGSTGRKESSLPRGDCWIIGGEAATLDTSPGQNSLDMSVEGFN